MPQKQPRMDDELDPFFYRTTIGRYGIAERRILRRVDKSDEYAHVRVSVQPSPTGSGNVLSWHAGDHIPVKFAGFVIDGATTALSKGIFNGIPFVDISATVETGSYHESDSNGPAFREAAENATAEALRRAQPVLLEAVVALTISVPEEFTGAVQQIVSAYDGVIQSMSGEDRIISLTTNLAASGFMAEAMEHTQGAGFSLRIINFVESLTRGPRDDWSTLT